MSMSSRTVVSAEAGPTDDRSTALDHFRLGPLSFLVLSAWCGLASGLLELLAIVLRKQVFDNNHFYMMTRHFVWLVPLSNLVIFLVSGAVLWLLLGWGSCGRTALARRLLGTMTLLAPLWAAFPRIYGPAGLLVAVGLSWRLVPLLERRAAALRRLIRLSLPLFVGAVALLAACVWGSDWLKVLRQERMPLPASPAANVLLIVMDTVGADHLSLYGYSRPTSPTLDELAQKGVRFDNAWATSSWTLPSHASMFTGYWPHELSASWLTPLDAAKPTLAEYLGSRGYATAGFAANYTYCAVDSGLARGFAVYRDFIFPRLTALRVAALIHRIVDTLPFVKQFVEQQWDFDLFWPVAHNVWWLLKEDRKEAPDINREFLEWLARRRQPARPFFAFLNYYDAHGPYRLRQTAIHRCGEPPRDRRDTNLIQDWSVLSDQGPTDRQINLVRNAYDNCVADLDEQIGQLWDKLERRGVLEQTWVIIVGDHGESFGEQPGVFRHGTSLYRAQVHVPLLIIPPAGGPSPLVVTKSVSLRDLPATVVDVLGLTAGSPFPGESLARLWKGPIPAAPSVPEVSSQALSEVVPLDPANPDPSQLLEPRWPLAALTAGDWRYIRREGEIREELFHSRLDREEQHNLASDPASQPVLERMRRTLSQLTAGPLTPDRFKP